MNTYSILRVDTNAMPTELNQFCDACAIDGIINNSSICNMKMGKFSHEAWWATFFDNKIVSISGMYHFPEMGDNCWRVMFRTATLAEHRGLAGPVSKKFTHDFNWSRILPLQIEHGRQHNADMFVFTTNSSINGDQHSFKTNRVISRALVQAGLVKLLYQDIILYNTVQNVWQVIV